MEITRELLEKRLNVIQADVSHGQTELDSVAMKLQRAIGRLEETRTWRDLCNGIEIEPEDTPPDDNGIITLEQFGEMIGAESIEEDSTGEDHDIPSDS